MRLLAYWNENEMNRNKQMQTPHDAVEASLTILQILLSTQLAVCRGDAVAGVELTRADVATPSAGTSGLATAHAPAIAALAPALPRVLRGAGARSAISVDPEGTTQTSLALLWTASTPCYQYGLCPLVRR